MNLGMSGRLEIGGGRPKHTKWEILLRPVDGGRAQALRFIDPRGFGRLSIHKGQIADKLIDPKSRVYGAPIAALGPDLLCPFHMEGDVSLRLHRWMAALDTSTPIKTALMDQSRLAGLGNIYTSELLWRAHIHPQRPSNQIKRDEMLRMIEKCSEMLALAIYNGGTSLGDANDYVDTAGKTGNFARYLGVYGKTGQKCSCKKGKIQALKMGGRNTFFCNACQK